MRRHALATLLIVGMVIPTSATAQTLAAGSECVLTDTIAVRKSPKRGKKRNYRRGTSITVLSVGKKYAFVKIKKRKGYTKLSWFKKVCPTAVEDDPVPEPPAPIETAGGFETAPTQDSFSDPSPVGIPLPPGGSEISAVPIGAGTPSTGSAAFGGTYKIKIAVMDLRAADDIDKQLVASLTNVIPETLDRLGPFKAISSQDIVRMLQYESSQQLLGCGDDSCIAEIGGALGADFMITGDLTKVSGTTMIQMQLTNINESRVDARASKQHEGSDPELFAAIRGATKQLVRDILGQRSGTVLVQVSEEGASIMIDNAIIGVSPMPESVVVAGGSHALTVEKQGFVVHRKDFTVYEDKQALLDVSLRPSNDFIKKYQDEAGFTRTISWLTIGGGILAVGGGAALIYSSQGRVNRTDRAIQAYNEKDVRTQDEYDRLGNRLQRIANYETGATVAVAAGGAAILTGLIIRWMGDDPDKYDAVLEAKPELGGLGVSAQGVVLHGTF